MSIFNRLTARITGRIHTARVTRNRFYDLQRLEQEIAQCQQVLNQAEQDLKRVEEQQTNTERWLCSTRKQFGIRERQIKQALQQGENQIAQELAEDLVDLEILIKQEERSLLIQAEQITHLKRDIHDGTQAIANLQARMSPDSESSTASTAPFFDVTEFNESLQCLKRVHQVLKVDMQTDPLHTGHMKPTLFNHAFSSTNPQSKAKHINAVIKRAKAGLEMGR